MGKEQDRTIGVWMNEMKGRKVKEGKERIWKAVSLRFLIGKSESGVCGGTIVEGRKVRCKKWGG